MSNGWIDEMIWPQRQQSGSLIILELTKFYRFFFENLFILKEVSYFLLILHETLNIIRCPCDKISLLEY